MSISLYDKYGGFATISELVHTFYGHVLAHKTLHVFFKNIDMEILIKHQIELICFILGGPVEYSGKSLQLAHQDLPIKNCDFDDVKKCLELSMREKGVEENDIIIISSIVESKRSEIVHA